jgi:tetratricopeptide (TPR) repeat protein
VRKGTGRLVVVPVVLLSLFLFRCAGWNAYQNNMWHGKRALNMEDYGQARQDFLKAAQASPDARSYAYAATASYKTHDLPEAWRLLDEAAKRDGKTYMILRILGYRTLVLLAGGREAEGLDALEGYLAAYGNADPMATIGVVERMARSGRIDLPRLERLLDEQITTYETDLEQFWSAGTGWVGEKHAPTPAMEGQR